MSSATGASWQTSGIEENIRDCCFLLTSTVNDGIMRARSRGAGVVIGDGAQDRPVIPPDGMGPHVGVAQIDFLDKLHGWILFKGNDCVDNTQPCTLSRVLLATEDGGVTCTPITDIDRARSTPRKRPAAGRKP